MNVLIDTNVLLDDILNRSQAETARKISHLVEDNLISGFITANSITDVFYIVSKNKSGELARKIISDLLFTFLVVAVDGEDCLNALDLPLQDFEDALALVLCKV